MLVKLIVVIGTPGIVIEVVVHDRVDPGLDLWFRELSQQVVNPLLALVFDTQIISHMQHRGHLGSRRLFLQQHVAEIDALNELFGI